MNEGDKVVCVWVDGHYYAVPLSAPAAGDKVVCVPLEHGQIAVPTSAPAEGDHVLMVPNDMGQYVAIGIPMTGGLVDTWGYCRGSQCAHPDGLRAVKVITGDEATLALQASGTVVAYGSDSYGQVSNVPEGLIATDVALSGRMGAAIQVDGSVVSWTNRTITHPMPVGTTGKAIYGGWAGIVAVQDDDSLVVWDYYDWMGMSPTPSGIVAEKIAVGSAHGVYMEEDGTVGAWGYNGDGQCNVPPGLTAIDIGAGYDNSIALQADGSVVVWGDDTYGQVSNVPEGLVAKKVCGAGWLMIAIDVNDELVWWGKTSTVRYPPTSGTKVTSVSGGGYNFSSILK